jgi:cation transport ATPase
LSKSEIFSVKNVDCPSCATKIENGLNSLDGINDAVFDFASLTLHVKTKEIERIIEEVHKLEPGVELVPKSAQPASHDHDEASGGFKLKKELTVLARADVGVAMGALGSDAAVETADVVLMNDSPMKMAEAVALPTPDFFQ